VFAVSANIVVWHGMLTACWKYSDLNCMLHVHSVRNALLLEAELFVAFSTGDNY